MTINDFLFLTPFVAGALGALLKDITDDGQLQLPALRDGNLYLGFFGRMLTGAVAGFIPNIDPIYAATVGFTGVSVLPILMSKYAELTSPKVSTIEKTITDICSSFGVDAALALAVAKCESNLDPKAQNVNSDKSIDRGLFQINSKYHPEVDDVSAYDPFCATVFFCQAVKAGHLDWWNASKTCWASSQKS